MTPTEKREMAGLVVMLAMLAAMAVVGEIIRAESKAAAFNRLTGSKVTAWDAYWLDLRVQEQVHEQDVGEKGSR